MAPRGQDVSKKPDEARKPEGKDEKPAALPQAVPEHHWQCNQEFHARKEVVSSQEKFPWKVPARSVVLSCLPGLLLSCQPSLVMLCLPVNVGVTR